MEQRSASEVDWTRQAAFTFFGFAYLVCLSSGLLHAQPFIDSPASIQSASATDRQARG